MLLLMVWDQVNTSNSYIIIITTIITIIIEMVSETTTMTMGTGGDGFAVNVIVSVWKYFHVSCASFRELIAEY